MKRTYSFVKDGDNVHGTMSVLPDKPKNILVLFARWISTGTMPKEIELILNPNHTFVKSKNGDTLEKVVATNFDNPLFPLPKQLKYIYKSGKIETVEDEQAMKSARKLGISSTDILGENIREFA